MEKLGCLRIYHYKITQYTKSSYNDIVHLSYLTKLALRCSLSASAAYTPVFVVNISKTYEDTLMWVWKVSRSNISTLPCSRDFKWCDDLSTRFWLSSETPSSMCTFIEWPWCQMDFLCMIKCSLHQDSSIFQKFWSKFINTVQIMILITFLTIQKKLRKIFLQQFMIIFHLKRKQKFKIKNYFSGRSRTGSVVLDSRSLINPFFHCNLLTCHVPRPNVDIGIISNK